MAIRFGPENLEIHMKTIEHLARRLVSSLVVFTLMGLAMQALAAPTDQTATVLRVKGGARYSTDNRTWQALKVGDVLKPGIIAIRHAFRRERRGGHRGDRHAMAAEGTGQQEGRQS